MDDKTKCCLGILVIFIIIAVFIFWPQPHEALKTEIECKNTTADENGTGEFLIYTNYFEDNETEDLENASVEVNLTYENGTTVKYNLTTNHLGIGKIANLPVGEYNVSARIIGNDTYDNSTYYGVNIIREYIAPSQDTDREHLSPTSTEYQTYTTTRYYWVYV